MTYLATVTPAANPPFDVLHLKAPLLIPTGADPTVANWKAPKLSTGTIPINVAAVGAAPVPVQQVALVCVRLAPNQLVVPTTTHFFDAMVYLALVTRTASAAEKLVISTLAVLDVRAGVALLFTV